MVRVAKETRKVKESATGSKNVVRELWSGK